MTKIERKEVGFTVSSDSDEDEDVKDSEEEENSMKHDHLPDMHMDGPVTRKAVRGMRVIRFN